MIDILGVTKRFGTIEVLKGIDMKVEKGEIVSLMGPSGAGKTTLLQIVGTLEPPTSGAVMIGGVDVLALKSRALAEFRNRSIGFVFQFHQLLNEFTAEENVMMPALIAGESMRKARKEARELLDFLGLSSRCEHKPSELSGGEKQRVAVARALIRRPQLLLADEPSGSLDSENRDELHKLFFNLREEFGQTIFIVTHDEQLAQRSDRILYINDGQLVNR